MTSNFSFTTKAAIIGLALMTALAFSGAIIATPTAHGQTNAELQDQIANLLEQIQDLQARLGQTSLEIYNFTRSLKEGHSGADVTALQNYLISEGHSIPAGATGYFGSQTRAAVAEWQFTHGVAPAVGYFGPISREKYDSLMERKTNDPPDPIVDTVNGEMVDSSDGLLEPQPDYDMEVISLMIHEEVNKIRSDNGVSSLSWNDDLADVAIRHSGDQAEDNINLIDMEKHCAYPILRHEGFDFGLNVGDRLKNSDVIYQMAAENLVLFSGMKRSVFRYSIGDKPEPCDQVENLNFSSESTVEEKEQVLIDEINYREGLLENVETVEWVSREWKTEKEIAEEAAEKWFNSSGHRRNMLDNRLSNGGVGTSLVNGYFVITHVMTR